MFCNNCNVFVDDRSNFCPECGGPVIKKKPKFSVVSIISLIMIIIAIAPFFASFIFATESSLGDGAGWLIFIIAFITIPLTGYYAAIFHVSRSWDRERPYKNTRKNLLVILFLSIPLLIAGLFVGYGFVYEYDRKHSPENLWTCIDYYADNSSKYLSDVKSAPDNMKIIFYFNSCDGSFYCTSDGSKADGVLKYGKDLNYNYYKGYYTYVKESDKNKQYKSKNVLFFDFNITINELVENSISSQYNKNMHLEMEMLGKDKYQSSYIYTSDKTYYCQRKFN